MSQAVCWIIGPAVYLAVGIFTSGLAWRLGRWFIVAPSPVRSGIFPRPTRGTRGFRVIADCLFFPQLIRSDLYLWAAAFLFHLSLLGVLLGHLHLLFRFPENLESWVSVASAPAGLALGAAWTLSAAYLLARRFTPSGRDVSQLSDYLILLLIMSIALTGISLKMFSPLDLGVYQVYLQNLLALRPHLPAPLLASPHQRLFAAHLLSVNLLLVCFPFSKLVHCFGSFITNWIRRG